MNDNMELMKWCRECEEEDKEQNLQEQHTAAGNEKWEDQLGNVYRRQRHRMTKIVDNYLSWANPDNSSEFRKLT